LNATSLGGPQNKRILHLKKHIWNALTGFWDSIA